MLHPILKKERLTKDVRYQEFKEVTLGWCSCKMHPSRVTSILQLLPPGGRIFYTLPGFDKERRPGYNDFILHSGDDPVKYTDLIFDLYGTLVDIHTEENDLVWEKTAFYFGFYGAAYTPEELHRAFRQAMAQREAQAGQSYECFPDIPFELVMADLFRAKGITENADVLGLNAAQLFRISSLEYIRLYPGALDALAKLRASGCRLWLLSNAQRVFTAYELNLLGLGDQLDGIYISSDYRCRKPDTRFFQALLQEQNLDPKKCLMIGNDLHTDIGGARAAGLDTLYMHTNLTPPDQREALPSREPGHYEYEGWDWEELARLILNINEKE